MVTWFNKKYTQLKRYVTDTAVWITVLLGGVYVCLATARLLVMRLSSNEDHMYNYLPVTVNFFAEFVKLIVCGILAIRLFIKEGRPCREIFYHTMKDYCKLLKWAVPGLLYFVDNLIQFYTMASFGPAVAVLLSNFVVITTSILFRIILRRKFQSVQWAAVLILFLSLVSLSSLTNDHVHQYKEHNVDHVISTVKPLDSHDALCLPQKTQSSGKADEKQDGDSEENSNQTFKFTNGHLLVLVQCFVSSLANIYNEKIFKEDKGMEESIYVQNSKLYMFGVLFNSLGLLIHKQYRTRLLSCGIFYGYNIYTVLLIFLTAFFGLTIALMLKFRDNMFHIMSSSTATVMVITLSVAFLDFKPSLNFFLQAPIVLLAIFVYNAGKAKDQSMVEESLAKQKSNGYVDVEERQRLTSFDNSEDEDSV